MTDPLGQSQVLPYLQGLSKKGFTIHLLSCEKTESFTKNKSLVADMLRGYDIHWHILPYTKNPPALSTWYDIKKLKQNAARLFRQQHIDLVHTRPGVPALVGLWMKKKFGVKFLHDIREFYADSRVEGGMWNLKNPVFKKIYDFFKKREAEEVQQADGIVCLTYAAEKIIKELPEYKQGTPLDVIPCSADLQLFDPSTISIEQRSALKTALELDDHLVVSYLGSIGGWYLIAEMMRFCKMLIEKKPGVKFLFISPHRHAAIVAAAESFGVPSSAIITKKASRKEVPMYLSLSDLSLFFIKPCYSKLSSSPTKHGEIMAMGIPLITNSGVGDVKEIVLKYDSGIVLDEFSDEAFSTAIERISQLNRFDPAKIREGANEFYSLETAIEKYYKIYTAILNFKP
ncbi:MAG TPA: glycosyltransferase [Ferruginibacter sp.]|nr:glycosyltransferase [Ferruginibacter sp.]